MSSQFLRIEALVSELKAGGRLTIAVFFNGGVFDEGNITSTLDEAPVTYQTC